MMSFVRSGCCNLKCGLSFGPRPFAQSPQNRALRALVGGFLLVGCRSLLCVESLSARVRDLCDPRLTVLRTLLFGLSSYLLSLNPKTPGIVQRFVDLPETQRR